MASKRKAPAAKGDGEGKKVRGISSFFGAAAPAPGGTSTTAAASTPDTIAVSKFDKEGWYNGLNDEQKELLKLEYETLHVSWLAELRETLVSPGFLELKRFLAEEKGRGKVVFPVEEDIYSWSRYCPFNTVKIVILGQDPYHGPNQAHGLSFSVRPPTRAPPSLANMYKALAKDYPSFKKPPNNGGLLSPWAEQGVLMLNACLTVRQAEANSHAKKGWEILTEKVIELVSEKRRNGVVFMAWGTFAQTRCKGVDKKKHLVLQSVHPSPLSASRGFFDCGHFKKANEFLEQKYGPTGVVDWNLDRAPVSDAVTGPSASAKPVSPPVAEKQKPLTAAVKKDGKKAAEKEKSEVDEIVKQVVNASEAAAAAGGKVRNSRKKAAKKEGESDYDSEGLD
ncbi:uracil-DNA glycosylase [Peziza echinospora]|nr:uracil-DNA glycosylase [Peziza echinospora]